MQFSSQISLQGFNTFGVNAKAKEFIQIKHENELQPLCDYLNLSGSPHLIIGGGSNLLLTKDFNGLVIINQLKGIKLIDESPSYYLIEAKSGEIWHDFVMHCLDKGYNGLENLSLIPGTVGASPIQNIGAYGAEAKDFIDSVQYIHLPTGKIITISNQDCQFSYRDSIFKQQLSGQYFILSVQFKLQKKYTLNTQYGAIQDALQKQGVLTPTAKAISQAVCSIRSNKLPDPKLIGNAGSFFKNPVVSKEQFELLLQNFPNMVAYPDKNGKKLAAGWLIEQTGWKGKCIGNVKVHQDQALVITNTGSATGLEILNFSQNIIDEVQAKFGVHLNREVVVV